MAIDSPQGSYFVTSTSQPVPAGSLPSDVVDLTGALSYGVSGLSAGSTIQVTITLPSGSNPGSAYKLINGSYQDVSSLAIFDGDTVTLSLTDGGAGDSDGTANGTIQDPVVFGRAAPPAAPVVTTQPAAQSVLAGSPYGFTATASGSPIPSVQWQVSTDGGSTFSNVAGGNHYTLSGTATLADFGKRFRAVFNNALGSAVTNAVTLTVGGIDPPHLQSSASPIVVGQSVTLTASIASTSGTMKFFDGATLLGSKSTTTGSAALTLNSLKIGSHSLTTSFTPAKATTSLVSAPLSQEVKPADTTLTVTPSINPSTIGQSVTFKAKLARIAPGAGTPTGGTVTFFDNGVARATKTVSSGAASYATNAVTVGDHAITASYSGSTTDNASITATAMAESVSPANTTTVLTSNVNPAVHGQTVTVKAIVKRVAPGAGTVPGGTVQFFDGDILVGTVNVKSGVASLATKALTVGVHPITAIYGGTATDLASFSATTLNQVINPAASKITLASSALTTTFGHSGSITATVTTVSPGAGVPTGSVDFYNNGSYLTTVSLSSVGKAAIPIASLSRGTHALTAVYSGSVNNLTVTTVVALNETIT